MLLQTKLNVSIANNEDYPSARQVQTHSFRRPNFSQALHLPVSLAQVYARPFSSGSCVPYGMEACSGLDRPFVPSRSRSSDGRRIAGITSISKRILVVIILKGTRSTAVQFNLDSLMQRLQCSVCIRA